MQFLRKMVGFVDKDPELFNCTVDDNIKMGNVRLTEREIVNYAKMADAHEFIQDFRNVSTSKTDIINL